MNAWLMASLPALSPGLFLGLILLLLTLTFLAAGAWWGVGIQPAVDWGKRRVDWLAGERDRAADLGFEFRAWMTIRIGAIVVLCGIGLWVGIPIVGAILVVGAFFGVPFLFSGRGVSLRSKRERLFINAMRNMRERIVTANQSPDQALAELGRDPTKGLERILSPLASRAPMSVNLVEMGKRSRSPLIEAAANLLIFSRSRSTDVLVHNMEVILIPVSEAELAIQEEAAVTLSQQRAVVMVMVGLMTFLFAGMMRADTYSSFYRGLEGQLVLVGVLVVFSFLVWLIGRIMKVQKWTRWDLVKIAQLEDRLGA